MIDYLDQFDYVETDYMDSHIEIYSPLIGQYVIEFSYLEHNLNLLVADLISDRSHDHGYIITMKMKMYDKIELLERMASHGKFHGISELKKILPTIPKLKAVNTFRNSVAHAVWATMKPSGATRTKTKVDSNSGVWFQNKTLSKNVIKSELKKLRLVTDKIMDLQI